MLTFNEAHSRSCGDHLYQAAAFDGGKPVRFLEQEITAVRTNFVDIVRRDEWGETHQRLWRDEFPLYLWYLSPDP
jgi:hypothetical protein